MRLHNSHKLSLNLAETHVTELLIGALLQTAEAKEVFINKQEFDASTKPLIRNRHKRTGSFAPPYFTRGQKDFSES